MKNIKLFLFFVLLFSTLKPFAQTTKQLKGIISDSLGRGVESAHVMLKNVGQNAILAFTRTDKQGKYSLELPSNGKNFTISLSSVGFEKINYQWVFPDSTQTQFQQNFIIRSKNYTLEEVVVRERKSIVVKTDTISFRADSFRNNTERVAEDLLKKIPGIDISSEGKISVNGVGIDRIMIDGDDVVDKSYTLLSKNLPANLIENVQILNNFSKNKLLKSVKKSDKIALNLTLKSKEAFFGELTGNFGTKSFNEERLNLFSFRKKSKTYMIGSGNNIGKDILGNIDGLSESNFQDNEKDHLKSIILQPFSNATSLPNPNIDAANTNINEAKLGSINSLQKFSDKFNLKFNGYIHSDNKEAFQQNQAKYLTSDGISFQENFQLKQTPLSSFGQIEGIITPNESSQLRLLSKIKFNSTNSYNDLAFNKNPLQENLLNKSVFVENFINYTHKFNDKNLIDIEALYSHQDLKQTYILNNNLFSDLLPSTVSYLNLQQNNSLQRDYWGILLNYFGNTKKWRYSVQMGIIHQTDIINSNLLSGITKDSLLKIDTRFNNQFEIPHTKYTSKIELKRLWGKWEFYNQVGIDFWDIRRNNVDGFVTTINTFSPNENFRMERGLGLHGKMKIRYDYGNQLPDLKNLYPNYILTSYRTINRGTNQIEIIGKSQVSVGYNYDDWTDKQLSIATFFSYTNQPIGYNNILSIKPTYSLSDIQIGNGTQSFIYFINCRKFLPFLASAIKFNATIINSTFENKVNTNQNRLNQFTSQEYKTSIKSAFRSIFNFEAGAIYQVSTNDTKIGSLENNIQNYRLNLYSQIYLNFGKKYNSTIKADSYEIKSIGRIQFYSFSFNYQVIENKLSMSLTGENLSFNDQLSIINQSDYLINTTSYRLLSGYLIAGVSYKF